MRNTLPRLLSLPLAAVLLTGCYAPDGGVMPTTGRGFTYVSTPYMPVTVSVIDTRSEEPFFVMAIPPGQQLTFRFIEGGGDDQVWTPDRMQWELFAQKSYSGSLNNQLTCPPANARRIDVALRESPEEPPTPDTERLRVDQFGTGEKPEWWTPAGGPLPTGRARIYD
jgi:hypothetical protein